MGDRAVGNVQADVRRHGWLDTCNKKTKDGAAVRDMFLPSILLRALRCIVAVLWPCKEYDHERRHDVSLSNHFPTYGVELFRNLTLAVFN